MEDIQDRNLISAAGDEILPGRAQSVIEDLRGRVFIRNRQFDLLDDGLIAILVPRFDGWLLRRVLMPRLKRPFFRIRLDAAGSFVWNELDGVASVGEIVSRWILKNPQEAMAEARVAIFVRALALQGHVLERDRGADAC